MDQNKKKRDTDDMENGLVKELKRLRKEMKRQKNGIRRLKRRRSDTYLQESSLRQPLLSLENLLPRNEGTDKEHSEDKLEALETQSVLGKGVIASNKQTVTAEIPKEGTSEEQVLDPELLLAIGRKVDASRPLYANGGHAAAADWGETAA
ncbi:hypothetical protein WN55_05325 [Dufourea novaeangliae]|uniref:Uncharacterized protein n=1 Tax=Dufourea novaeangliae TaxID=178035 RepID=A0A154PN18_DUFNO|nr:hypothetical protein WN55_05325 [Dufourea novaeangliae]